MIGCGSDGRLFKAGFMFAMYGKIPYLTIHGKCKPTKCKKKEKKKRKVRKRKKNKIMQIEKSMFLKKWCRVPF